MDVECLPSLHELCLQVCLARITTSLSITNVWVIRRLLMFPWYTSNKSIKFVIDTFICDHFIEIAETDEILSLDEEEMHWLFDNQDIIACEATMLHCLVRWYQYQERQRQKAFKHLFSKIHLTFIPSEHLWAVIKKHELIKVMPELIEYKVSKLKRFRGELNMADSLYQQNRSNIALITGYFQLQDVYKNDIMYIHSISSYWPFNSSQKITKFDIAHLHALKSSTQNNRDICYFVPFREKIFVFSVYMKREIKTQAATLCLKLNTNSYSQHAPCPDYIKMGSITVSCGTYIFFLGCASSLVHEPPNTVYRYDTLHDKWKEMAPMIHTHSSPTLAIPYDDRYIFVFGPHDFEKYDIYTNSWSAIQPPQKRIMYWSTVHAINNKLYAFEYHYTGEELNEVFVYDLLRNTWQKRLLNPLLPKFYRTKSFLGKTFAVFESRHSRKSLGNQDVCAFTISELNVENTKGYPTHLCNNASNTWNRYAEPRYMIMLSRGARVQFEHSQTLKCTAIVTDSNMNVPQTGWHIDKIWE